MKSSRRAQWGEESIRVEVKQPSLTQEPENQKVFEVCHLGINEVRFRVMIGSYGPGTESKPTPRYYWTLGESATVHCRDVEVANWFRGEFFKWLKSMDGVVLEKVES